MSSEINIRGKWYYSASKVAEVLEVNLDLLRLYIRRGVFKTARKVRGTRWYVRKKEVDKIKEKGLDVKGVFSEKKEA